MTFFNYSVFLAGSLAGYLEVISLVSVEGVEPLFSLGGSTSLLLVAFGWVLDFLGTYSGDSESFLIFFTG